MTDPQKLKRKLLSRKRKEYVSDWGKGLSTGSTLLNLATSGRSSVGFLPGNLFFVVGDSSSGKTFLSMTCFAEACNNSHYQNHRLIFDNAENGALMDWARFFGPSAAEKIEPPGKHSSTSLEEFYFNLSDCFSDGRPFIYVLDSMDALTPKDDEEKFDEDKKAHEQGKTTKGTYGTVKAKLNSNNLRLVFNKLRQDGRSILILISQTRDNIGFGAQFNPKTRSGGNALTFYAALEMWSSIKEHLKVRHKGKDREIGIVSKIRIKKNRLSGKDRTILLPILHSTGIDDLGSCLRYLIEEKHWKGGDDNVSAPEFDYLGDHEGLIQQIEEQEREKELRLLTASVWNEIENAIKVQRKPRYG